MLQVDLLAPTCFAIPTFDLYYDTWVWIYIATDKCLGKKQTNKNYLQKHKWNSKMISNLNGLWCYTFSNKYIFVVGVYAIQTIDFPYSIHHWKLFIQENVIKFDYQGNVLSGVFNLMPTPRERHYCERTGNVRCWSVQLNNTLFEK